MTDEAVRGESLDSADPVCCAPGCTKRPPYKCPRCVQHYCSVTCYRAHSERCVQEFAHDASKHLKGVNVSTEQRQAFNDLLARVRNEEDPFAFEKSFDDEDPDPTSSSDWLHDSDDGPEDDGVKQTESMDGEMHVLAELMQSLDEPGRQALFTVLNSAMEQIHGRDAFQQQTPTVEEPHVDPEDPPFSRTAPPVTDAGHTAQSQKPRPSESPQDIADTLETLVDEMESLDLSYDEILTRLPEPLRKEFEKRLRDGTVARVVSVWIPWWLPTPGSDESVVESNKTPAPLPPLPTADQLLVPAHITRRKASRHLHYGVIDVLAAYTLTMRLCNGEWWGDAFAAKTVWQLSGVLKEDARYTSLEATCTAVLGRITREQCRNVAVQALQDVADVLSGRSDWVVRGVYECQCLLEAGAKHAVRGKAEVRKRVRKAAFFVSWATCQESDLYERLCRDLLSYVQMEVARAEEVKIAARVVERRKQRHPKITVLNDEE